MDYYDQEKNVKEYSEMAEGYDGRDLIAVLHKYLPKGSSLLELGMGPGKDLDLLSETYHVTGSDSSRVFLNLHRSRNPQADLLLLDAKSIDTEKTFDGIYSNKVLIHLGRSDLADSFRRQSEVLNDAGIALHSFWYGTGEEEHHGLRFAYYTETELVEAAGDNFEILEIERYKEMEDNDSLYIILRKRETVSAD